MEIKIVSAMPDGLSLTITDMFFESYDEAFKVIKAVEKLNQPKKSVKNDLLH